MKTIKDYKIRCKQRRIMSFIRRNWFYLLESFLLGIAVGMYIFSLII